jgi:hypothetical protein
VRGSSLVAASLLGVAVVIPVVVQTQPAEASCTPASDVWIRLAKPAVIAPGATVVIPMTWGVKPLPGNSYNNGTIINSVRWRISVDSGLTIKAAVEKDPLSTSRLQISVPAHVTGSTASFDMQLGSSPLTKRAGLVTVRLSPSAAPGSKVRVRASIGVYAGSMGSSCLADYHPGDNASTVYVMATGSPKPPTHSASPTPTPSTASPTPSLSPSPSTSPSTSDSPSPSPTPSETALALPLPTPGPSGSGSGTVPVALVVVGSGGVGAALLGGGFVLRRWRRPRPDIS